MTAKDGENDNKAKHHSKYSQPVTAGHLNDLKEEIIAAVTEAIKRNGGQPTKKWLKTKEVQKLLGISVTTLLTFRINGILPYTKMGGVIYYDYEDILGAMEKLKSNNKSNDRRRKYPDLR